MELITDLKAISKEMGLRREGSSLWGGGLLGLYARGKAYLLSPIP